MKIEKVGEAYSVFEESDDPMENLKKRRTIFVFVLFCICFFAIIGWEIVRTMPSKYRGNELSYEIEGQTIPTLYAYTKHTDVFMIKEHKDHSDKNMKVEYVVIFYKTPLTKELTDTYVAELYKQGYKDVVHEGTLLYVLNSEDETSFKYVYIGNTQVKYGVCSSGTYQKVFKTSRINN